MTSETDYAWWRAACESEIGPIHENAPECGYYRKKSKSGSPEPVAIFKEGDKLIALIGRDGREVQADEIWTWVATNPVTYEAYDAYMNGEPWADEIAPMGNNAPESEAEADEIENAIAAALAELAKPVSDQAHADRLAAHRERLSGLYKAQEAKRKAEKEPHDAAAKAVQAKYVPVLDKIEAAGVKIRNALTAYLCKAEAEKQAQAAAAIQAGETVTPESVKVKAGGTTARATALRTVKTAVVTDYAAALAHFANSPEVVEAVNKLASRAAKAGVPVPGVQIKDEKVAA